MDIPMNEAPRPAKPSWHERVRSLKSLPPIFRRVWDAAPGVVASSVLFRLMAALIPITMLGVTRRIIDSIYGVTSHQKPLSGGFWFLVALEFGLASLGIIMARLIDFCDSVIGGCYTRHFNTLIMRHAAILDLTSYTNPIFYDKL